MGLNAALEWFFDPILGTSKPRAGATATGLLQVGRRLQIAPLASFYTVLKTTQYRLLLNGVPLPQDDPAVIAQAQQLPELTTLLRLELPFDYRLSEAASFNFGVRSSLRGRAIPDPGFRLNEQVEIWAFVGLTLRAATSLDHGAWLPL